MLTSSAYAKTLDGPLVPVREFILEHEIQVLEGSYVGAHDPRIAPHFYAFEIWPGVAEPELARYENERDLRIPSGYRLILQRASGMKLGRLQLYGVPLSMLRSQGMLDRRRRQPLDLSAASTSWATEHRISRGLFHFGGVNWSYSEIAGLFCNDAAECVAMLRDGSEVARFQGYEAVIEFGLSTIPT